MEYIKTFESFDSVNESEDPSIFFPDVKSALPALEKMIKTEIGAPIKLNAELKTGRQGAYIEISSGELLGMLGNTLAKTLFSSINVRFWGGTVVRDGNSIWFNPKIQYTHPSGGSNGTDFVWDGLWYILKDHDKYKAGEWVAGRKLFK